MQLDLDAFLAADFAGRIELVNRTRGVRLWSPQLAEVWAVITARLEAAGRLDQAAGRQLIRELIALAPDSPAAEEGFRRWIGDDGRDAAPAAPEIVHLIVSCEKYKEKAMALYGTLALHLLPTYVLLGGGKAPEAVFEGPFLTVSAPDSYEALTEKILEGLLAVRRRFGRVGVLKIDDDSVFVGPPQPERIAALIASTQYAGFTVGGNDFDRCWHAGKCEHRSDEPYRRRFRGRWAAGPLYYLGPQAVDVLVREYVFFPGEFDGENTGLEDKAVADALRAHGLEPTGRDLSPVFGIAGPFSGSFGDAPPALRD